MCSQAQGLGGLNSHCDSVWDPESTEIPAHGYSLPFHVQQGVQGRKVVQAGWDQCVDSNSHLLYLCLHSPVCVCVCVQALSHNSPLNIIHPYYVSLFFIMIYMPCHGFIMIYAPIPRRAYGRHHTAKRQQPCSGEETWLSP